MGFLEYYLSFDRTSSKSEFSHGSLMTPIRFKNRLKVFPICRKKRLNGIEVFKLLKCLLCHGQGLTSRLRPWAIGSEVCAHAWGPRWCKSLQVKRKYRWYRLNILSLNEVALCRVLFPLFQNDPRGVDVINTGGLSSETNLLPADQVFGMFLHGCQDYFSYYIFNDKGRAGTSPTVVLNMSALLRSLLFSDSLRKTYNSQHFRIIKSITSPESAGAAMTVKETVTPIGFTRLESIFLLFGETFRNRILH